MAGPSEIWSNLMHTFCCRHIGHQDTSSFLVVMILRVRNCFFSSALPVHFQDYHVSSYSNLPNLEMRLNILSMEHIALLAFPLKKRMTHVIKYPFLHEYSL